MAGRGLRPELQAPPEIFYNETEARKYSQNSRMMEIQSKMAERALELLGLADGEVSFLLDVGCGSGLSGELLTERGHMWLGIDISTAMLTVAAERDVEGDVILADMGDGLPFRPGTFDGCISISAVQWLCYANKAVCSPPHRLLHFFSSLYACLKRGARAVFQLYPQNADQLELISSQAMKAGFSGGMVVDFPNSTKAKKFFLCLFSGGTASLPKALVDEDAQEGVQYTNSRLRYSSLKGKSVKKSRNWILEKKERQRLQGKDVRHNSKYTGRRRKFCF